MWVCLKIIYHWFNTFHTKKNMFLIISWFFQFRTAQHQKESAPWQPRFPSVTVFTCEALSIAAAASVTCIRWSLPFKARAAPGHELRHAWKLIIFEELLSFVGYTSMNTCLMHACETICVCIYIHIYTYVYIYI